MSSVRYLLSSNYANLWGLGTLFAWTDEVAKTLSIICYFGMVGMRGRNDDITPWRVLYLSA